VDVGAQRLVLMMLPIHWGQPHACSYLDDREARFVWVHPRVPLSQTAYSRLIAMGFRRSGAHVYRPACGQCDECIPLRVLVAEFKPSRAQRRIARRQEGRSVRLRRAEFLPAHYELFLRYQRARFPDSVMADMAESDYCDFIASPWLTTWLLEILRGDQLASVTVVDVLDDALSAVYTFYDPERMGESLGTHAILDLIDLARRWELRWCYLGYWIENSKQMAYKQKFRPAEVLLDGRWRRLDPLGAIKLDRPDVL
jgi:arginine-tRNA-protein transferase